MNARIVTTASIVLVLPFAASHASAQGFRVNGPLLRDDGGEDVTEFALSASGSTAVFLADPEEDDRFELFAAPVDRSGAWRRLSLPGTWCGGPLRVGAGRVVFRAALALLGPYELYSVPVDGSSTAVRVSQALSTSSVSGYAIAAQSARVLYLVDHGYPSERELFSAPLDGGAAPVEIGDALVPGGEVHAFRVSSDGRTVVFTADRAIDELSELWAAPVEGGSEPVRLSGAMVTGADVRADFVLAASGSRVVFAADRASDEVFELWSAPLDGSAPPVFLSGALVAGGDVGMFRTSSVGGRVLFLADKVVDEAVQLWVAPAAGGAEPILLGGASVPYRRVRDFETASGRVAYLADEDEQNAFELYGVPLSGGSAVRLTPALEPDPYGASPFSFAFADSGSRVVYSTDQDAEDVFELWSVPADGSAAPRKLNGPLSPEGDVQGFLVAGGRVVYRAGSELGQGFELWSVPLGGGAPPLRLHDPLGLHGSVEPGFALAGLTRVVYRADAAVDGTFGLWSVPRDASQPPCELSMPLDPAAIIDSVTEFAWTSDGRRLLYGAGAYLGRSLRGGVFSADLAQLGPHEQPPVVLLGPGGGTLTSPQGGYAAFTAYDPLCEVWPCEKYLRCAPGDGSAARILGHWLGEIEDARFGAGGAWMAVHQRSFDPFGGSASTLLTVPSDGHSAAAVLSDPQHFLGRFQVAAGGPWVVYEERVDGLEHLFSAPLDLGSPPAQLNPPLSEPEQEVLGFELTPDEGAVLMLADPVERGRFEFYLAPIDGGSPAQLVGSAGGIGVNGGFRLTADGQQVAFLVDHELWSLVLDPTGGHLPIRLTTAGVGGGIDGFALSPDSARAVVRSAFFDYGRYELFSVPLDGSQAPVRLHPGLAPGDAVEYDAFRITADSSRVVFAAKLGTELELWSAPLDGGAPPLALNAPFPPGGGLRGTGAGNTFAVSPDGTHVAYRADQLVPGVIELFLVPSDARRAPERLSAPLVAGGDVQDAFAFSPDGSGVAYLADQELDGIVELFVSFVDPPHVLRARPPEPLH